MLKLPDETLANSETVPKKCVRPPVRLHYKAATSCVSLLISSVSLSISHRRRSAARVSVAPLPGTSSRCCSLHLAFPSLLPYFSRLSFTRHLWASFSPSVKQSSGSSDSSGSISTESTPSPGGRMSTVLPSDELRR